VERVILSLKDARIAAAPPDAYLLRQGAAAERYGARVAEALREAGLAVVLHCGGGNFKAQMKKADTSGARYAVIVGDDEAAAGQVTVKPLREQAEQQRLPIADAIGRIRKQ
jgi:histidyl-tRNA synthetase